MVTLIVYTWVFPPHFFFEPSTPYICSLPASWSALLSHHVKDRKHSYFFWPRNYFSSYLSFWQWVQRWADGLHEVSVVLWVCCAFQLVHFGGVSKTFPLLLLWKKMVIWTLMKGALIQMYNFTQKRGYWWGSSSRAVSCKVGCAGLCLWFGP